MEENISKKIKLNRKMVEAFHLKFDRVTVRRMSEITGYSISYLSKAFNPYGRWYDAYNEWKQEQLDIIKVQAEEKIKHSLDLATDVMLSFITPEKDGKNNNHPKYIIAAAKDILDRGGLKAPEKLVIDDPKSESLADSITDMFAKKKHKEAENE